jgi:hypothetical protein
MNEKRIFKALTSTLVLAVGAKLSLHAQEAQPYQGVVGRTLAESKGMVAGARESARRRAERSVDSDRRCGLWRCRNIRRAHPDSHVRRSGQQWFALYQLPYMRHLRADPLGAVDRPQQRVRA